MPRSTSVAHPLLVVALRAPPPVWLLTAAQWFLHDEVFTQGTSIERSTFWARFQVWEWAGDVGRRVAAKQLIGVAAMTGCSALV
jgi:hypothetical protein